MVTTNPRQLCYTSMLLTSCCLCRWPADRGVCGGNDNVFRDNLIEDVGYECTDTGAVRYFLVCPAIFREIA